jgi:hypothetical protein
MNKEYPLIYYKKTDKEKNNPFRARTVGFQEYAVLDHENNNAETRYNGNTLRKIFKSAGKVNLRLNKKKFSRYNETIFKEKSTKDRQVS